MSDGRGATEEHCSSRTYVEGKWSPTAWSQTNEDKHTKRIV